MDKNDLEQEVQYLEDIHEIKNLIGRYSYLETAGRTDDMMKLFASKTRDVRIEVAGSGVWESGKSEGLYRFLSRYDHMPHAGLLIVHALASPSIEVAEDGNTAKGMWLSPGHEAMPRKDDKPVAAWSWVKYAIDFVKEDDGWKFRHFHVYPILKCEPLENWAEKNPEKAVFPLPDPVKPDRPPSYSWRYGPDVATENVPAPPEPYASFDHKTSY